MYFASSLKSMAINTNSIFTINSKCSPQLTEWLNYSDSLTDKLKQLKGDAQVQLISQCWMSTDWWCSNFLQITDSKVYKREIIMKSHNITYWYARSIIPQKCYNLDPAFFGRLEKESIKNLIFKESRVQRVHRFSYPVDEQCLEFYWAKRNLHHVEGELWVRLTEYSFQEKEYFYLVEIMLPELENMNT